MPPIPKWNSFFVYEMTLRNASDGAKHKCLIAHLAVVLYQAF